MFYDQFLFRTKIVRFEQTNKSFSLLYYIGPRISLILKVTHILPHKKLCILRPDYIHGAGLIKLLFILETGLIEVNKTCIFINNSIAQQLSRTN